MKIEWVPQSTLVNTHSGLRQESDVPVVRVETLKEWLTEQRDKASFYGKHEARAMLDFMLTSLKEQP